MTLAERLTKIDQINAAIFGLYQEGEGEFVPPMERVRDVEWKRIEGEVERALAAVADLTLTDDGVPGVSWE